MKKSVLFVTLRNSSFTLPVSQGFKELGFEVHLFDYLKPDLVARGLGLIANISFDSKFDSLYRKWINHKLLKSVIQKRPNYLFVIKG